MRRLVAVVFSVFFTGSVAGTEPTVVQSARGQSSRLTQETSAPINLQSRARWDQIIEDFAASVVAINDGSLNKSVFSNDAFAIPFDRDRKENVHELSAYFKGGRLLSIQSLGSIPTEGATRLIKDLKAANPDLPVAIAKEVLIDSPAALTRADVLLNRWIASIIGQISDSPVALIALQAPARSGQEAELTLIVVKGATDTTGQSVISEVYFGTTGQATR